MAATATDIKTNEVIREIKRKQMKSKNNKIRKPSAEFKKINKVEQIDAALIENFQKAIINQG